MRKVQSIDNLRRVALEKGGLCLSEEYVNPQTKIQFSCVKGHKWEAFPFNVLKGHWCPECARENKNGSYRIIKEDMDILADENRGKCLSNNYKGIKEPLLWKCGDCNHEWNATYQSIKMGSWCPACRYKRGNYKRDTLENMQDIAKERDGQCLSNEYINARTHLKWRCKEGHEWEAVPFAIKRGDWCPECAKTNGARKFSMDKIFTICNDKNGKCLDENYKNTNQKLNFICSENHRWQMSVSSLLNDKWCPECEKADKLQELKDIAISKGGVCVSDEYLGVQKKLKWRCKEGHEWEATPNNIKNVGSWCKVCAINARKK